MDPLSRAAGALVLLLLAAPAAAPAADAAGFQPRFLPTLEPGRTDRPVRIDGELDDPAWATAVKATGWSETNPGNQTQPAVDTEAWITHDDEHLYVAFVAKDAPGDVRVSVCDRDRIFQDDYIGLMFDPYGDQTSAYELFVNPLGIQGDLRMLPGGNEDMAFDMVWDSRGKVTDDGYQVEVAIPFSSLRLPPRREQTWRVNFWRDRQREVRYKYAWAAIDRDNPCFMCQWGTMSGLSIGDMGRGAEVIASVIGSQAGAVADTGDPFSSFGNDDPDADASASVKYALSSAAFAELTVNPDFSQVESDAGQIDVNRTFALFFPERRPFFQEGSDLYGTWIDAVYTRSLNDPSVAGKLTMQGDRFSGVYTVARDEHSPVILPTEELSEFALLGQSTSNILRMRRAFANESYVGGLLTDRRLDGGGSGTTGGMDARYRYGSWSLELQGLLSRTVEPVDQGTIDDIDGRDGNGHTLALDGETFDGHAEYASVEYGDRRYELNLDYWAYSPSFRADNGFVSRNDFREASFWNGLIFRPNGKWIVEWSPNVGIGRVWDFRDRFQDEWFRPGFWLHTKAQTEIGGQFLGSKERFGHAGEVIPGIRVWSAWLETKPWAALGFGGNTNIGQGIYRDLDAPELADQRNVSLFANAKLGRRITSNLTWNYSRMDARDRDEKLFSGYILRNRFTVNFSQEWFLRLVVQWNDFSNRLDVEPLLTYRINPFTVFYLGSNSRIQQYGTDEYDELASDRWQETSRQFFAKLQYQFRL